MSIADRIRISQNAYREAIACMEYRMVDRHASTVTMHFADGSFITFNIRYEVATCSAIS